MKNAHGVQLVSWRCGKCHKIYTVGELTELKSVKMVPGDSDPKKNYGYTPRCVCGYTFHKDKWIQTTTVRTSGMEIRVSTVDLEMNHAHLNDTKPIWYETMIFIKSSQIATESAECDYQWRYGTKKEALAAHNEVVRKLRRSLFDIRTDEYGGRLLLR